MYVCMNVVCMSTLISHCGMGGVDIVGGMGDKLKCM